MTARERSRSYDAVSPSATSESPSQCSAREPAASAPRATNGDRERRQLGRPPEPADRPRRAARAAAPRAAPAASRGRAVARVTCRGGATGSAVSVPAASRQASGIRHAELGEQRDVAQQGDGAAQQRDGGDGAAALAEAHARGRAPARARAWRARATGPARSSGGRRRTTRPRPGAIRSAVSAQATAISPSSSTGTPSAAARAGSRCWRPGRRCPSAVRQSTGSSVRSPARSSACWMTCSLWASAGVVDAGAAAGDLAGRQPERRRRPAPPRAWCCRCPCRR